MMTQIMHDSFSSNIPKTPLGLYLALSRGVSIPHELWLSARFRRKFFLRGLIMPVLTYRLLKMLTEHPAYEKVLLTQPGLPCRIHRPWLSNKMSRRERLAALIHHYERISALLGNRMFNTLLSVSGITLATIVGKDNQTYVLRFLSTHKLDREGEATLILSDTAGQMLSEITFTLCQRFNENALFIGGLQGPNTADAQNRIQQATKGFHGLFPKRIVVEALLRLAQLLGIKNVCAVANTSHVYHALRYYNRKKHMHADYDALWEVVGGIRTPDGSYQLPLEISRKRLEDIASKKRVEYRRRFELLDEINLQMRAFFHRTDRNAIRGMTLMVVKSVCCIIRH